MSLTRSPFPLPHLAALLIAAALSGCAAPAPAPSPAPVSAKRAPATAAAAAKSTAPAKTAKAPPPASSDDSVVVCEDEAATGSNIRKHKCYRETAEMRRQKQEQIDALHRAQGANSGPTNF